MRVTTRWTVSASLFWAMSCTAPVDRASDPGAKPGPAVAQQPEAGALMRTDAARAVLRARLRASLARSPDAMAVEQRADGLRVVRHRGGFQHATLRARDANGELVQSCTNDSTTAQSALMGDAP